MTAVNLVLAFCNVLLAALMMAWFLSFATGDAASSALEMAARHPGRWRAGVGLLALGLLVLFPAQVPGFLGERVRMGLYLGAYPLLYGGVVLHASTRWADLGPDDPVGSTWGGRLP